MHTRGPLRAASFFLPTAYETRKRRTLIALLAVLLLVPAARVAMPYGVKDLPARGYEVEEPR
jgi:hypothetical protein